MVKNEYTENKMNLKQKKNYGLQRGTPTKRQFPTDKSIKIISKPIEYISQDAALQYIRNQIQQRIKVLNIQKPPRVPLNLKRRHL